MSARLVLAALAGLLATAASAQGPSTPPAGGEPPCAPVKPCEIPDEPAAAPAEGPAEFGAEARALFDLVACAGAKPPPALDAKAVEGFCAGQRKALAAFREAAPVASAFLARLRPAGLPTTVLVPLGGGDLLSALVAFPELRNVTTLSPEPAGDPRRLAAPRSPAEARAELEAARAASEGTLRAAAGEAARGGAGLQLAASLTALAATGHEPVGLRFFRVEPGGGLHYLTRAELAAAEKGKGPSPFANSELAFVKRGEDPRTRLRTHRHVASELSDAALTRSPGILAHLTSKGELAVSLRGGPRLLGRPDHARFRALLLRQAALVLSDSTGPSPADARAASLVQETYGAYQGSAHADPAADAALVALFAAQPARPLPFRFGHLDRAGHPHLVVTRRPPGR